MTQSLIECVPNFSEGRNTTSVDELVSSIASIPGVQVLHRTSDRDHNRSVITFVGKPEPVMKAAVEATRAAARLIDLRTHRGVHPRLGALDVLPFVPLGGYTLTDCAQFAHQTGERIVTELAIPVYFYGAAALRSERSALENVRRGEFESLLEEAVKNPARSPDLGGPALHPTAGAVIVGARNILIAFNVNLKTTDLTIARDIARAIRASNGGFPAVKALGVPLPSLAQVQVSMNLTDFTVTPLHIVYSRIAELAAEKGVEIAESELIGLLPQGAVNSAFSHFLKLPGFSSNRVIEHQILDRPAQLP